MVAASKQHLNCASSPSYLSSYLITQHILTLLFLSILPFQMSWEPAAHILNQNLVNIFHASRALSQLRGTAEAKDDTSPTFQLIKALVKGKSILRRTIHNPTSPSRKTRMCPWCYKHFKDGASFAGHSNKHRSEPNYRTIKEVAKILEKSWFE